MLLVALLIALIAWSGGFVTFVYRLPEQVQAPGRGTDAIVVLTGGSQRLETGLELLAKGWSERLFISGVYRGIDAAELIRVARQEPGQLECCIFIDYNADDTIGNARETARWIARHRIRSIRLVTSSYHMPRSLLEFEAVLPDTTILAHPVIPPNVKQAEWYRHPGTAGLFAVEYTKFLLARLRLSMEALSRAALQDGDTSEAGA